MTRSLQRTTVTRSSLIQASVFAPLTFKVLYASGGAAGVILAGQFPRSAATSLRSSLIPSGTLLMFGPRTSVRAALLAVATR
jgi:hypothetical protein